MNAKIGLNERMQKKRFALFLDDVWGEGIKMMEELGLLRLAEHSNSNIIVRFRDHNTFLNIRDSKVTVNSGTTTHC